MLTPISLLDLEYVCYNMRERDKEEVYALRDHNNPFRLAWEATSFIRNNGRGRISWIGGKPAAVGAFTQHHPGVWEVWMFGTNQFKAAAMPLLGWVRREAADILATTDAHRLQCDSRADYLEAHKMIQAMGAKREMLMRQYGKDGSDYIRFIWLKGMSDHVVEPGYTREIA